MTDKQQRFVEEYCVDFNATQAAIRAGYSERTARSIASENLSKPDISAAIEQRMDRLSMTATEATLRLSRWGRGSFEPFLTEDGKLTLTSPEAWDAIDLLKKVKVTERFIPGDDGEDAEMERKTEIEIHDAKDAVVQIAKIRGLYTDRLEVTGKILLVADPDDVEPATDG